MKNYELIFIDSTLGIYEEHILFYKVKNIKIKKMRFSDFNNYKTMITINNEIIIFSECQFLSKTLISDFND